METVLVKFKIKAGMKAKLSEYLNELRDRMSECEETLRYEGCKFESFFVTDDELIVFKEVEDFVESKRRQRIACHPLYEVVKRMSMDCLDARIELFSSLDISVK